MAEPLTTSSLPPFVSVHTRPQTDRRAGQCESAGRRQSAARLNLAGHA